MPWLTLTGWPESFQGFSCLCSPDLAVGAVGLYTRYHIGLFRVGSGNLNPSPHACVSGTLLLGYSPSLASPLPAAMNLTAMGTLYKWKHTASVLGLAHFTEHDVLRDLPGCKRGSGSLLLQLCGYTTVCLSSHPKWTLVIHLTNILCANDEASTIFAAAHMTAADTVEPGPQT